jgi:hypothetical protein
VNAVKHHFYSQSLLKGISFKIDRLFKKNKKNKGKKLFLKQKYEAFELA